MTPTLNLTSRQLTNAKIAIGAGNAVYDLNRGGQSLIVGLPLVYTSDVAGSSYGNKYGYSALPDRAPPGYIVTQVRNDSSSGLNMFVAYNKDTNTAIVGIAGVNTSSNHR